MATAVRAEATFITKPISSKVITLPRVRSLLAHSRINGFIHSSTKRTLSSQARKRRSLTAIAHGGGGAPATGSSPLDAVQLQMPGTGVDQVNMVMKFGGSSVASAERMWEVAQIVCAFPEYLPCVVLSAMGKTTNMLLQAGEEALVTPPGNIPSLAPLRYVSIPPKSPFKATLNLIVNTVKKF